MCEQAQLDRILNAIARHSQETFGDKLEAVILYGSYARGDYDEGSDIDIMVLVDMDAQELSRYRRDFARLTSRLSLEDADCTTIAICLKDTYTFHRYYSAMPFYQSVIREGVRVVA